jgi:hypothetical protein
MRGVGGHRLPSPHLISLSLTPIGVLLALEYDLLKSPVGAYVQKTTCGPLIDMALYVMLLMQTNPVLGQRGQREGVGLWKS